jgi:O-methyltransferase
MMSRTIADEVRRRNLTYLGPEKSNSLFDCVEETLSTHTLGDFVEFGVALGGSGICLASFLDGDRHYVGFDVFSMIPPPSAADGEDVNARYKTIAAGKSAGIGGDQYYGYVENLHEVVKANFRSFGLSDQKISLVKGLFEETLPLHGSIKIAIAHIDCDWYEPVLTCLNYAWPRLSQGGYIILDDYNDWSGCRKATNEFVSSNKDVKVTRYQPHAVLHKPIAA